MPPLTEIHEPVTSWQFWTWIGVAVHFAVQLVLGFRVVMQRRPPGETLAWVMLIFVFPIFGPALYLLFGELWLGRRRERRFVELYPPIRRWLATLPERRLVDWSRLDDDFEPMARCGERTIGVPAVGGNQLTLLDKWFDVFERVILDIDAAQSTCHLEFYIWEAGGIADQVVEALIRAASAASSAACSSTPWAAGRFCVSESATNFAPPACTCTQRCPAVCGGCRSCGSTCGSTARSSSSTAASATPAA